MSHYCQRCGAHARLWHLTISPNDPQGQWYDARVCGICTRSVLSEIELVKGVEERIYVYLTLQEAP